MDANVQGNILYFIEVEQEENAIIQQVENASNDENWLQNEQNLAGNAPTIYFNIDPGLPEEPEEPQIAAIPEPIENNEQVENIQAATITNSIPPNILRSNKNKSTELNDDSDVAKGILIKNDILKTMTPKILEMTFVNDMAHITIKDEKGHPMFLTQQLKVNILL